LKPALERGAASAPACSAQGVCCRIAGAGWRKGFDPYMILWVLQGPFTAAGRPAYAGSHLLEVSL